MGKTQRRTRTHVKHKDSSKARRTRRRTKDIDQIQDEIRAAQLPSRAAAAAAAGAPPPINPDLPGCVPCC